MYGLLCNALPNAAQGSQYRNHSAWQSLSASARDLMEKLLAADAAARLSVDDALRHPWLTDCPGIICDVRFGARASHSKSERDVVVKMILGTHQAVVALQRERGMCMWAAGSKRFHLHLRFTDETCAAAVACLDEVLGLAQGQEEQTRLLRLRKFLADALSEKGIVRKHSIAALAGIPDKASVIDHVVDSYSRLISRVMQAVECSLEVSPLGSIPLGINLVRHKLLMFTAEQLGRERALLCGHLRKPETLQDPEVACRVNRVIGARKLLLGSSAVDQNSLSEGLDSFQLDAAAPSGIVSGDMGLLPALNLMDAPLLEASDLAQLENAEDRALSLTGGETPQLSEWYHLITNLIDKIHQHVILHIVSSITPCTSPASSHANP